jgi:hypothetical protein
VVVNWAIGVASDQWRVAEQLGKEFDNDSTHANQYVSRRCKEPQRKISNKNVFSGGEEFRGGFASLSVLYHERVVFHSLHQSIMASSNAEFSSQLTSLAKSPLYSSLSQTLFSRDSISPNSKLPSNHQVSPIRML